MEYRFLWCFTFLPFRIQSKVNHHDRILLDNPYQHDDSHQGVQIKINVEDQQRQKRAEARGGQSRKYCDRMDVALVKNAEHNVNYQDGNEDQYPKPRHG